MRYTPGRGKPQFADWSRLLITFDLLDENHRLVVNAVGQAGFERGVNPSSIEADKRYAFTVRLPLPTAQWERIEYLRLITWNVSTY